MIRKYEEHSGWLAELPERILEVLAVKGRLSLTQLKAHLKPRIISTDFTLGDVLYHIRELKGRGYVTQKQGTYTLTLKGRKYLDDSLAAGPVDCEIENFHVSDGPDPERER